MKFGSSNNLVSLSSIFWTAILVGLFTFRGGSKGFFVSLWLLITAYLFVQAAIFIYMVIFFIRHNRQRELMQRQWLFKAGSFPLIIFSFYLLSIILSL